MHKVAIVILNWNGQSMLAQYLPSVMRHSRNDAVVYVADNASTDNSLAYLAQHFPHCQTIAARRRDGRPPRHSGLPTQTFGHARQGIV